MKLRVILLLGGLFLATSCGYYAPVMPPQGLLFTAVEAPIDTNYDQTPMRRNYGQTSSYSILGLFAFGSASVNRAAENGRIDTVEHVEYEYFHVLYIFQRFTIKVFGE